MNILRKLALASLIVMMGVSFVSNAHGNKGTGSRSKETKDSLVILLSSKSAQTIEIDGVNYRKVVGPARFLHNGTYLICDTALWSVDSKIIDAWGNVSILQDETVLTSDNLKYYIDFDLAEFRGSVVQLTDKDHNTLRTRHLDYNTADSVAVFQNGGSMRDKDGQIIESRNGTYDSKIKTFTFEVDVNMFTDSIFVKTNSLIYESDKDLATFSSATDVWKDENMLSSQSGWYDRNVELFFFTGKVHVMSEDQEGWCDSLYFYRNTSDVDMYGNAQVTDTTRNVFGLAGKIQYVDSLSKVVMTRDPAVISETEETDGSLDTLYLGADKLVYYTQKMCDIDSLKVVDADARLAILEVDPVGEFRKKAAEAAAKAAEEAAKNDPNYRPKPSQGAAGKPNPSKPGSLAGGPASVSGNVAPTQQKPSAGAPQRPNIPERRDSLSANDSLMMRSDSLSVTTDSLSVGLDSLALSEVVEEPKDTTDIGFLEAIRNVRIYKKNLQVVCDSLLYSDLDSLARLFKEPIIWQDVEKQYTADSVTLVIRNGAMEKANLMSNAFISMEQDTVHYNQIKGAEMLAYFDEKGELIRFDALGGASAVFYIEENEALATVNKPESKMLSALLKDGEVQRIYYFEEAKNDGYPIVQLSKEEQRLKGFNWQPEKRPEDRNAVTPLSLRPSERLRYAARPKAKYTQTDIYFPGYMRDVYRQIEVRDSLNRIRERERRLEEQRREEMARLDSIARVDSLILADSIARADSIALADSLRKVAVADSIAVQDSLKVVADSLASVQDVKVLTPEEIEAAEKAARKAEIEKARAEKKAAREARKKAKQEALEQKWTELDKRDADKAAAKEAKRLAKERKHKRKALEDAAKRAEKEARTLEKYKEMYLRRKAKELQKAARN